MLNIYLLDQLYGVHKLLTHVLPIKTGLDGSGYAVFRLHNSSQYVLNKVTFTFADLAQGMEIYIYVSDTYDIDPRVEWVNLNDTRTVTIPSILPLSVKYIHIKVLKSNVHNNYYNLDFELRYWTNYFSTMNLSDCLCILDFDTQANTTIPSKVVNANVMNHGVQILGTGYAHFTNDNNIIHILNDGNYINAISFYIKGFLGNKINNTNIKQTIFKTYRTLYYGAIDSNSPYVELKLNTSNHELELTLYNGNNTTVDIETGVYIQDFTKEHCIGLTIDANMNNYTLFLSLDGQIFVPNNNVIQFLNNFAHEVGGILIGNNNMPDYGTQPLYADIDFLAIYKEAHTIPDHIRFYKLRGLYE